MSDIIRLWVETSYHSAFRCGGWAFVRAESGGVAGRAGGERATSEAAMARQALLEAFAGVPPSAEVRVCSASAGVLRAPPSMGLVPGQAPPDDPAFWAPLRAVVAERRVTFVSATATPRTPVAFAAAWAEQGRDKAKARGPFAAVIPRSMIANAGVPA